MTGKDLTYGVPALIVALEQVLFAIFFHYSFRSREYHEDVLQKQGLTVNRKGTFAAALQAINPMDVIGGIFTSVQLVLSGGYKNGASANEEKAVGGGRHGRGRGRGRYMQVDGTGYHPYGQESVDEGDKFLQPNPMGQRSRSNSASPPLYQQQQSQYQPPAGAPPQGRYEDYRREHERSRSREMGDYATGPRDMV